MGLGWQTWKGHACHLCMELSVAGRESRTVSPTWGEVDPSMKVPHLPEDRKACPVKALQGWYYAWQGEDT